MPTKLDPLTFLTTCGLVAACSCPTWSAHASPVAHSADSTWTHYSSVELFMEGSMLMEEEFWHEAERVWAYASGTRPKNRVLKYRQAVCLHNIGEDWPKTVSVLQEVVNAPLTLRYDPFNPNQKLPPLDAWLWLASAEHRMGHFEEARSHVDSFLAKAGEKHGSMEWASKILAEVRFAERQLAAPTNASVSPMEVNSESNETHPVLTADGRTLFFSSNRGRSNGSNHGRVDPNSKAHYYDIYKTEMGMDSTWSDPEYLNIGVRHHAKVVGSDAFGQKLVVLDDDGWTHELKTTQRWERGWTVAEPLYLDKTIPNEGEIVFFPQKDRLIASLKRRKGEGGFDLYESSLDEHGRWSKLKSLGSRVNTWGDEITPFVAADGQTVFFASNGLQSMGGHDIYRTTRNAAGGWTEPEHLGSPINSVDDDMAFVIGAKGEVGYFATRRNLTRGDLELYEVDMNGGGVLEQELVVLSLDATELEDADQPEVLVVRDVETGDVVQRVEKQNTDDVFNLILPTGRDYIVESLSEGEAEDAGTSDDAERSTAFSRRLSLSEELEPEVIEVPFEDVFLTEEVQGMEGGSAEVQELAFVVTAPKPALEVGGTDKAPLSQESAEHGAEEPELTEVTTDAIEDASSSTVEEALKEDVAVERAEEKAEEETEDVAATSVDVSSEQNEETAKPQATEKQVDDKSAVVQRSSVEPKVESAPIAPLALSDVGSGQALLAVQLYSGQVHSGRMDLTSVVDHVKNAATQGPPVIRIEGSASDGPSSRAGGNLELASSRAMDVYLRLVGSLKDAGLEQGRDYRTMVVRRVQPDGDTPASFRGEGVHPASFQYVRVDVDLP